MDLTGVARALVDLTGLDSTLRETPGLDRTLMDLTVLDGTLRETPGLDRTRQNFGGFGRQKSGPGRVDRTWPRQNLGSRSFARALSRTSTALFQYLTGLYRL